MRNRFGRVSHARFLPLRFFPSSVRVFCPNIHGSGSSCFPLQFLGYLSIELDDLSLFDRHHDGLVCMRFDDFGYEFFASRALGTKYVVLNIGLYDFPSCDMNGYTLVRSAPNDL
jgi:hypothetical protein